MKEEEKTEAANGQAGDGQAAKGQAEEEQAGKGQDGRVEREQIGRWLDCLASKSPVPGGGGASAVGGALAAALGQMVANLTVGKKLYAGVEEEMKEHLGELRRLQSELLCLAARDEEVFAPLAAAYRMPKDTREERLERERIMEERLLAASLVPLEIMEKAKQVLDIIGKLAQKGSRAAVSDAGVAVQFARAAVHGASMNVYINTKSMKNRGQARMLNKRADELAEAADARTAGIYGQVRQDLSK